MVGVRGNDMFGTKGTLMCGVIGTDIISGSGGTYLVLELEVMTCVVMVVLLYILCWLFRWDA